MKTTLYTVLCVAVRLGAVLLAVGVLERLPEVFLNNDGNGRFALSALLLMGAVLLLALALWLWPKILVWWAIGSPRQEFLESSITADQVHYIALSVTGVWLFISSLGGFIGHGVSILIYAHRLAYEDQLARIPDTEWHWLVQYAAMAVAGAGLALGARGLVGVFYRLRGYSAAKTVAVPEETSDKGD